MFPMFMFKSLGLISSRADRRVFLIYFLNSEMIKGMNLSLGIHAKDISLLSLPELKAHR